jgi:uncharacterized membrane protein
MKLLLFICTVFLSGCQNWGSSSLDESRYNDVELDDSDPNFKAAYAVIKTRCISCHNYHSEWASYTSSAKWLESNDIIPGNDVSSPLVNMLINEGGDMPRGAGSIPEAEYQALKLWIREIPNP